MTIENDNLIELKFKQQNNGLNSMSKLVTSNYKTLSPSTTKTSSPSSPSLSSPSSSSTSLSSSSYSLTSGFSSSNVNSSKADQILFEESFSKRPTLLSEYILSSTKEHYESNILSPAKLSFVSRESNVVDHFTELTLEEQTLLIDKWVPFSEIQQKILVPDADPKKFIFNYNSPNLSAKKELNYLGIVDVNPDEYTQKYGSELKSASDLPKYILDIKTPDNLKLAADVEGEPEMHELEGDIEALKLIDLEREDLTIYKQYLQKIGVVSN